MPSTFDRIAVPAAAPAAEAPAATTAHAAPAFADEAQSLARSLARRMRYELIRLDAGHPPSIVKLSSVTGGTPVSKSTQIAVELVQGIFQSVIDDAAVPEEFRHLILHLQVPMLRLTLGHAEYVPTAKAPGRPLLTRLALASAGWSRVGEFNQRLLAAARAAVRTVVAQPDAGPQQLHSALHQFVAFLAEEAKADNSAVERIRRAREQADEREAMQVRVALEIGRKFERQPVPLYLRNFLLGPWVKVLCAARERDSIEPEFSAPFETLADEVLSSVAGQQPGADRGRQDLSIARMLATIYRGLAMIEMAPTDVKDLATALMNTHAAAAEGAESDEPDQPDSGLDWEATGASPPRESVARTQPR